MTLVLLFLAVGALYLGAAEGAASGGERFEGTRRFGLFIGANNGGRGRVTLRYAVSDARAVSRVFAEMGGITTEDNILLIEPDIRNLNARLSALQNLVNQAKVGYKRTEIIFYYSGHADEEGLLLGNERLSYQDLRERINLIPSDMRIVILDSCSSGAFTRAKGGVKTQPFLMDSSISAEGYAFLTSSSATESSQESDSIASSYFTHSLVAGLRGAADMVGDGRVTLNEAYRFAYAETLARTETSLYGAQHPSYDMQVNGSGDVVLTDIKETSASLLIDGAIAGRLSIRDNSDYLVAEITKTPGRAMELGLEPGRYRITLQQGDTLARAEIVLSRNQQYQLSREVFRSISAGRTVARGGEAGETGDEFLYPDEAAILERARDLAREGDAGNDPDRDDGDRFSPGYWGINIQLIPGYNLLGFGRTGRSTDLFLLGLTVAHGQDLMGLGLAWIGLSNSGDVLGIQSSGIYNTITGDLMGVQAAGIFNTVGGEAAGVQTAGIFNTAGDDMQGIQAAGIFNVAGGDLLGAQFSLVNIAGGSASGTQWGLFNLAGADGGWALQMGLVNVSRNPNSLPLGLVNVVRDGILHPAIWYDDMEFTNLSFRSGSKYFYTLFMVGARQLFDHAIPLSRIQDNLMISGAGLGFELPLGKFFIDLDVLSGQILDLDNSSGMYSWVEDYSTNFVRVRLGGGFKLWEHLGVVGGISYDYLHRGNENSPNPVGSLSLHTFAGSTALRIHRLGFFAGLQF
jgi:hypothetical protein